MALTNAPSESNVNENWLFQFSADNDTCLEFDGTDDYVSFGNVLDRYVSFTLEAWIKTDSYSSSSGTQIILERSQDGSTAAKNTNWQIALSNNGLRCKYQYGSGSNVSNTVTTSAITVNNWHHVAVLRDDSNDEMRFYVDGVKIGTVTTNVSNSPTAGTSGEVTIGANFEQNNEFSNRIAHARVWSTARSDNQIAHYYNRTIDSTASNLVGYWKLDEGTGSTVADSSSNSNSGTITDATWTVGGFDKFIHSFGVATSDTTVDADYYPGAITNQGVSVRDSIDITTGKSTTSNLDINVANVMFDGIDLYKRIFNGTNNYLNKNVRVYAQFNGADSLSDCQRIFTGRIVDLKVNQNEELSLQINSYRPWDQVSFPQDQTHTTNTYVPTVYGDYDHNTSTVGTPVLVNNKLFPCPVIARSNSFITTLMPKSYSSSSNSFLNMHFGDDCFLPARTVSSPYNVNETTIVYDGQNCIETKLNKYFGGITRAHKNNPDTSLPEFSNQDLAFDNDESTFSTVTLSASDPSAVLAFGLDEHKFYSQVYRRIHVFVKNSASEVVNVIGIIGDGNYATQETRTEQQTFSNSSTIYEVVIDVRENDGGDNLFMPTGLSTNLKFLHVSGSYGTLSVQKVHVEVLAVAYGSEASDNDEKRIHMDSDANQINNTKFLYSGGDGLNASWDDGAIAHGHDAHRDLLMRFGGMSSDTPTNYASLNTDRAIDNWKIRYWQLEPTSLKNKLDQLAYEFGFCYKIDANGVLKYIHVKKSSELSATLNLTVNDINKVNISTTGLSEVITKMIINSDLHPANSQMYSESSTITNTATRAKYNLGDKEGIKQQNLDMNVGVIPTTANADCNADWYSYYNNIIGDIKVLVSCDVVNPAKGCQLETGDIVTFTDMPVEMFGTDFSTSKYFMIIQTNRLPGKVSITAREVG
tara:strand:- start:8605 stop:11376 length:2772 start_codon:yes stop_codon:yes gene_type:complete